MKENYGKAAGRLNALHQTFQHLRLYDASGGKGVLRTVREHIAVLKKTGAYGLELSANIRPPLNGLSVGVRPPGAQIAADQPVLARASEIAGLVEVEIKFHMDSPLRLFVKFIISSWKYRVKRKLQKANLRGGSKRRIWNRRPAPGAWYTFRRRESG